jgi:predicted RNA binding protein YcfA (HicA-like mRNA interferase family)
VRPVDWKELVSLCEAEGCQLDRQRGGHYIMTKPGLARPIVIPKKKDLREDLAIGRKELLANEKATRTTSQPSCQARSKGRPIDRTSK